MKEPDRQRDALPVDWMNRLYGVLREGRFEEAPLEDVEPLVLVTLTLLFGFRPATAVALKLSDFLVSEDELVFTEAFRKGYMARRCPLRRLTYPFSNCRHVRPLLRRFSQLCTSGTWAYLGTGNPSQQVFSALERCRTRWGLVYGTGYITAYSLRISCCSYLFALGVASERIKLHIGWAPNSDEWVTYVRDVPACRVASRFWCSLSSAAMDHVGQVPGYESTDNNT